MSSRFTLASSIWYRYFSLTRYTGLASPSSHFPNPAFPHENPTLLPSKEPFLAPLRQKDLGLLHLLLSSSSGAEARDGDRAGAWARARAGAEAEAGVGAEAEAESGAGAGTRAESGAGVGTRTWAASFCRGSSSSSAMFSIVTASVPSPPGDREGLTAG